MMFVEKLSPTKKYYHYLVEHNQNKNQFLFLFSNVLVQELLEEFIFELRKRFPKLVIESKSISHDRIGTNKNTIFYQNIDRQSLKEYTCVFKVPDIFDIEKANQEFFAIPGMNIKKTFKIKDVFTQYELDKYFVVNVSSDSDIETIIETLDWIYYNHFDVKVVLIGEKILCSDIVNKTKINPVVIYNNPFLISQLLDKCINVYSEDDLSDMEDKIIKDFKTNTIIEILEK